MLNWTYDILARIGYHHPLHPAVTHIPVGLVIGGFIFCLVAWIFNRKHVAESAKHCIILALLSVPPVALLGFMDWQHFYAGASLPPIRIKMILAVTLAVLLLIAWWVSRREDRHMSRLAVVYGLCLIMVIALGFLGGGLVYERKLGARVRQFGQRRRFNRDGGQAAYWSQWGLKVSQGESLQLRVEGQRANWVSRATPNKPVAGERPSEVFVVGGV